MHCKNIHRRMTVSDLFEGYAEDVTNVSRRTIPLLAPPNAEWPSFIIGNNRYGCKFGHLVRARNADRCDVCVQDVEIGNKKAIFLCECKYWDKNVDMSAMRAIVHGLNQKWPWKVGLVFCMKLQVFVRNGRILTLDVLRLVTKMAVPTGFFSLNEGVGNVCSLSSKHMVVQT